MKQKQNISIVKFKRVANVAKHIIFIKSDKLIETSLVVLDTGNQSQTKEVIAKLK